METTNSKTAPPAPEDPHKISFGCIFPPPAPTPSPAATAGHKILMASIRGSDGPFHAETDYVPASLAHDIQRELDDAETKWNEALDIGLKVVEERDAALATIQQNESDVAAAEMHRTEEAELRSFITHVNAQLAAKDTRIAELEKAVHGERSIKEAEKKILITEIEAHAKTKSDLAAAQEKAQLYLDGVATATAKQIALQKQLAAAQAVASEANKRIEVTRFAHFAQNVLIEELRAQLAATEQQLAAERELKQMWELRAMMLIEGTPTESDVKWCHDIIAAYTAARTPATPADGAGKE